MNKIRITSQKQYLISISVTAKSLITLLDLHKQRKQAGLQASFGEIVNESLQHLAQIKPLKKNREVTCL